ncbi:MAG: hypothetical protein K6F76_04180 [Clostridiales bacterium]|nr:hypothetical protein [Clostridiales bacterium]
MKKMINEFESELQKNGGVSCEGINAALNNIVEKYQEKSAFLLCPYISQRIGIAEWIVRCDVRGRYAKADRK